MLILATSCYEDYIQDYDHNVVYFSKQTDIRTFVVGEGMQIKVGVVLGGVRKNTVDRFVSYTMDQSLLNEETLEAMKGGLSYISENVASVSSLQMLPSSYYTISDDSKMIITPGEHMGTVTIKADSAKFLSDPLTLMANYALPFKIVKADADSVLQNMDYTVVGLRYENMLFGNYWHGGKTIIKDASGNTVQTVNYFTEIPSPESNIMTLKTIAPFSLKTNKIGNKSGSFVITLDNDRIRISSAEGSSIEVLPDGESMFNRAKLLQDRKLFLNYKYDNGDGTTAYCTDTLTFRNRIRDGVNEWQDEHPENYN